MVNVVGEGYAGHSLRHHSRLFKGISLIADIYPRPNPRGRIAAWERRVDI
jgi:hypothetical protein